MAYEIHKPKRKRFPTRPVILKGIGDLFQADLNDMSNLAPWNRNHKWIILVIDCFSKKAFARGTKNKKGETILEAFESILEESGVIPKNLQCDQGTEYFNASFKSMCAKKKINLYHTFSDKKASIIERLNRTLKTNMYRGFTERWTLNWIDELPNLISKYNNSKHRSIGMTPNQVTAENEDQVREKLMRPKHEGIQKFFVGDTVRVAPPKNIFAKGYTQTFTDELYKVSEVIKSRPRAYRLVDLLARPIKGSYYNEELQKTKIPDYARVEKVLRRKKGPKGQEMVRVKWQGYSTDFNQWIPAKDLYG